MTEQSKIKELEKKIKKLEQEVKVQKALIDVLRSFPENKDKQVLSKKGKTKNAVLKRAQGKSGSKAFSVTSRQSEDHSSAVRGELSNSEVMEKRD